MGRLKARVRGLTLIGVAVACVSLAVLATSAPAFASDESFVFQKITDVSPEIFVMNSDGTGQRQLTDDPAYDWYPAWTSGRQIVFSSTRGAGGLLRMDLDGGNVQQVVAPDAVATSGSGATAEVGEVHWVSADPGHNVVTFSNGSGAIFAVNKDGSNLQLVRKTDYNSYDPAISPDGSRILFKGYTPETEWDLWSINTDGSGLQLISPDAVVDPAWSPDGTKIAYTVQSSDPRVIHIADSDGTNASQLQVPGYVTSPSFSPNGQRISFTRQLSGSTYQVATADLDGSNEQVIADALNYPPEARWGDPSAPTSTPSDPTAPTAVINAPVDGATYAPNQVVLADYSCADEVGGSGIASCTGPVLSGFAIDTSTSGQHAFTVTGIDNAGNTNVTTVHYSVGTLPAGQISQVSAGVYHTCALTSGGAVKCWGANYAGQFGNGTTTSSPTPVDVSGLSSGVTAISAGGYHTCALTSGGAVKCWGANHSGQLDNGTMTSSPTPVDVSGLSSGVTAISAGGYHTCALTSGGAVKCWGANHSGQLGNGTTTNSPTPVDVSGLSSGVTAISAGGWHNCALTSGGAVKCWGLNDRGQLGNGTTTSSSTPVDVMWLVDATNPTVTLIDPADGATFAMGSVKNANYSCADEAGGSGIASCVGTVANGSPIDTSSSGTHSFTVTATDVAGNSSTVTHNYGISDGATPAVSIATPPDGATYAPNQLVLADYSCADEAGGSGIASCVGDALDSLPIDTSTVGPHTFTVTATDAAGNQTIKTISYTVQDLNAPGISITAPTGTYTQNETVLADYSCQDEAGGSGVASCVGDALDGLPIDTSTVGPHTFTVTASDNAGNTTSDSVTYTVLAPEPERLITFSSDRNGNYDIYRMDTDGSDLLQITSSSSRDWFPTWTQNRRLVFVTNRHGNHELYRVDRDGSNLLRLTTNYSMDTTPSGSPFHQKIAFASGRDGNEEIYVMNDDGSDPTRLTNASAKDSQPAISHDAQKVVFTSIRDGQNEIYSVNADGTGLNRLTTAGSSETTPSWSADATRIAFTTNRDGNDEIYTMRSDGTDLRRLTNSPGLDLEPSFSPDGEFIVFSSERDGNREIYRMRADGSQQTRLSVEVNTDDQAKWGSLESIYVPKPDTVAPTANISSPADGATYSTGSTIAADYDCNDEYGGSGIATCVGDIADGAAFDTSFGEHTFMVTATDAAGNQTAKTINYTVQDLTGPNISIASPTRTYTQNQAALASYSCQDQPGGSGVNTCTGTVLNGLPIDTSTVGSHTFTVNATDNAGNTSSKSVTYTVLAPEPERLITFSSNRNGNYEIYRMDTDGSDLLQITSSSSRDWFPTWTQNRRLVFVTNRHGNHELYRVDRDGSNLLRLTTNYSMDTTPSGSPFHQKIAFASGRDGNEEIYVMNDDGSDPTRLTNASAKDSQPAISHNAQKVVFTSIRDGQNEIYSVNADGTGLNRLTTAGSSETTPSWSADATRIAFTTNRDGNDEIYTMRSDGTDLRRLTNSPGLDLEPSFSPDGSQIIFSSERNGNREIYRMNADGSGQARLTVNSNIDDQGRWGSP